MSRDDIVVGAWFVGGTVTFICALVGFSCWVGSTTCSMQAARMGIKHDWSPMMGCMVEIRPGRWFPLKNYREIEQ